MIDAQTQSFLDLSHEADLRAAPFARTAVLTVVVEQKTSSLFVYAMLDTRCVGQTQCSTMEQAERWALDNWRVRPVEVPAPRKKRSKKR